MYHKHMTVQMLSNYPEAESHAESRDSEMKQYRLNREELSNRFERCLVLVNILSV